MENKISYNIVDSENINNSISRVISSSINFNVYSQPKGLLDLRNKICQLLQVDWNCQLTPNSMIITSGAQQALNIITYSLLNEGDTVLIEQPTYYGALDIFKSRKLNIVGVTLQEDGLNLRELEEKIQKHSPKLIYTIPTFNNPTGIAWNNEKRLEFLEIINRYNILVLEDDPYCKLKFSNYNYKTLYSLNNGKNVIYIGTFSKMISPSVNVGYILTNKDYIDTLSKFKETFDLSTSTFMQYVILDYLNNYNLSELMQNRTNIYMELLDKCIFDIKQKYGNDLVAYTKPMGGFFFLVKFKENYNNTLFENGNNFYIDKTHSNEARINICNYFK